MRKAFEIGGIVSAVVLIAFGVASIVLGFSGRSTVNSSLKAEQIKGTADMTPAQIAAEVKNAGLKNVSLPSCNVANKSVVDGSTARCFAQYMRIHALESTGGYTYSQMGIYVAAPNAPKSALMPGGGVENAQYAAKDAKTGQPVSNGARNVWVTETALTTALNMSYMASQLGLFSIVVGFALLLSGIGFAILAVGGALRTGEDSVLHGILTRWAPKTMAQSPSSRTPLPTA